jgi:hypothetical protein
MAINWPFANGISAYNNDLIMAITKVIVGNNIPIKIHLI